MRSLSARVLSLAAALFLGSAASAQPTYDLIIRGGRLLDGTGMPWRYADVGVRGDRIVYVGTLPNGATAQRTIDATGLYVAPGYIDPHSHATDSLMVPARAGVRALAHQGITTAVINHDGGGPTDLPAQFKTLVGNQPGVNIVPLIGHNSVRIETMAYDERDPTRQELETMRSIVRRAMEAGAWGLSDGLFYQPANHSKTAEVIALAQVAAEFNGLYTAHVRDDADYNVGAVGAVDEVIEVARATRKTAIVTHIKTMGPRAVGLSKQMIENIEKARAEGLEVWSDQHPYLASSSSLMAYLIPQWGQDGGPTAILGRLGDPEMITGIEANLRRRGGAEHIQLTQYPKNPAFEGRRLADLAKERNEDPVDTAIFLFRDSGGRVPVVSFTINEYDSDAFMKMPWNMTDTDGGAPVFGEGVPHPRTYGAFPHKIQRNVVERKIITLEHAIYTGTGLTASVHGLRDRGFIREGAYADIQVFDLARIKDTATYERPHSYAEGIVHLLVNGTPTITDGKFLDARPGRLLLRSDPTASTR